MTTSNTGHGVAAEAAPLAVASRPLERSESEQQGSKQVEPAGQQQAGSASTTRSGLLRPTSWKDCRTLHEIIFVHHACQGRVRCFKYHRTVVRRRCVRGPPTGLRPDTAAAVGTTTTSA